MLNEIYAGRFFAKPLQGTLFRTFRAMIMGHEDISVLFKYRRIKERVKKDLIRRNLNPGPSETGDQSRNDDSTLKESLESVSCDDNKLKKSYRSVEGNNPH